jgi:ATP-binding cassette subfamily C protein CydCD
MRRRLVLAVLSGTAALGAGIGLTAVSAWLITRAAAQPPVLALLVAVTAVRAFGISKGVLRYLERLLTHDVAFRVLARLRLVVYGQLARLAPAGLAGWRRGDLLTRLVDDVTAVQDRYARVRVPALAAGAAGLLAVGIAGWLLPVAGLVLAAGLAGSALAVPRLAVAVAAWADRRLAADRAELGARVVDTLTGVEELTVLGALPEQLAATDRVARRVARAESRLAWAHGLAVTLGTLVLGLTVAATLLVAAPAAAAGRIDGPVLAVLALLPLAAFEATSGLATAIRDRERVTAAMARVDEVLAVPPPLPEPATGPVPASHRIVVRGLAARWPGADRDTLRDIDLDLPPGKRLALVGPSGSGKSTLLAALLRLCPATGEVMLGGVALSEVPEPALRRTIGLAAADAHVFDSTLAANLRLAKPDATDDELWAALAQARLHDWAQSLPRGLATPVGEHGRNLSGGQRQRVALARALLADVPVLLCDEPDASLDPALADRLVADLLAAAGDRTVVIVTHGGLRDRRVDEVVVLDGGRVVERRLPVRAG